MSAAGARWGAQAGRHDLGRYTVFIMQQTIRPLQRRTAAELAVEAVRSMIVGGTLRAGERINEVRLAGQLGVSRTPLREALNRLAAEHAVEGTPNIGYMVHPLTLEEFEQIYDIRPILDPEALRLAGIPSKERLATLVRIGKGLAGERDPHRVLELDDAWHRELLAGCPNRVLLQIIDGIVLRTRRYELALMRERQSIARASEDHDRIIAALRQGDLDAACAALKHNMQSGRAAIVEWLKGRE
jgi:DNA-binding GntR family transcriptional regulator